MTEQGQPQSVTQASAQVAGAVVKGLTTSPAILGLIVLVAIGVGANFWFMSHMMAEGQARLVFLLEHCRDGAAPAAIKDR